MLEIFQRSEWNRAMMITVPEEAVGDCISARDVKERRHAEMAGSARQ